MTVLDESDQWDRELDRLNAMSPGEVASWYLTNGITVSWLRFHLEGHYRNRGQELPDELRSLPDPPRDGPALRLVPPLPATPVQKVPHDPPAPQDGPEPLQAWRDWTTWLGASQDRSDNTVRTYSRAVLRFLADTLCRPLGEYSEEAIARFLDAAAPRGRVKHDYFKAIRSFFGYAASRGLVPSNPAEGIQVKKPRRMPANVLTHEELVRLLVAAVDVLGERPAWGLLLTYSLGLRRVEAAGLRWSHIREGDSGPVIEIRVTKGFDQRPALPLSPLALECLARLREIPPPPQASLGPEYIVRARAQTITGWAHKAGTAAGLHPRKIGAHRLRATFATDLLRAGVDVKAVQQLLGHLRLESTAWYLGEADEGTLRNAVGRL